MGQLNNQSIGSLRGSLMTGVSSSGRGTGINQVFWWFHMEVLYEDYERLLIIGLNNR